MVDTGDLKSPGATRAGSSPALGTSHSRANACVRPFIFAWRRKDLSDV